MPSIDTKHREASKAAGHAQTPGWSHPPPAYSRVRVDAERSCQDGDCSNDEMHDEHSPLLPSHRHDHSAWLSRHDPLRRHTRGCGALLVAALVVLILVSTLRGDRGERGELRPHPPVRDGTMDQPAEWSEPVELDRKHWPRDNVPLYASIAWLSLSADDDLTYLRASGQGAKGTVTVMLADTLPADEWKKRTGGEKKDQVLVSVTARFTDVHLRDDAFVGGVTKGSKAHGVSMHSDHRDTSNPPSTLDFLVVVYLPQPEHRSKEGLAKDGSSFLKHFDADLQNMHLQYKVGAFEPSRSVAFDRFFTTQENGGAAIYGDLRANVRIGMSTVNGRIHAEPTGDWDMRAPTIDIASHNGGVSLSSLHASESIAIHTQNGGIDVTGVAVAPVIDASTKSGSLLGTYAPTKSLAAHAESGMVRVRVDLNQERPKAQSRFQTCKVAIGAQSGSVAIEYVNHTPAVRLLSEASASSGSVSVKHDAGFEGSFDLESTMGILKIEAGDAKERVFTIDTDERKDWGHKHVKGRTYLRKRSWPRPGKEPGFALSISHISSQVGNLLANF